MNKPNADKITDHEKLMIRLVKRLAKVFGTKDAPERDQLIFALHAFWEFMGALQLPDQWRRKVLNLSTALGELEKGIVPELLKPPERTMGGRPDDEWPIWRARGLAVLAMKARKKTGMSKRESVPDIKKCHPLLSAAPYVTGRKGSLTTSLRNWENRIAGTAIKPGDHLGLVAKEYWRTKKVLDDMTPQQAVATADMLLRSVLH